MIVKIIRPEETETDEKVCQFHVQECSIMDITMPCGRKAIYIISPNKITNKQDHVCGIHKNSVDAMFKRNG